MAEEMEEEPLVGMDAVNYVLEICGFATAAHRVSVINEGFTDVTDFGMMTASNFANMASRISRMRPALGGFRFGEVQVRNLEALAYWVRDLQRQSLPIVARDFTIEERNQCRERVDTEKFEVSQADSSKTPLPPKFETTDWVAWEIVFINYLSGIYGVTNVPLNYVIRKPQPEGHVFLTSTEKLVSSAPLTGYAYQSDTQNVYRILKSLTVGTDAWEWIKRYDANKDGHLAFDALRQHYDGPGEIDRRIALAKKQIKDLHYKSEQSFSFDKFSTRLNGAFQILAECKEGLTEKAKVDEMISSMSQCTNPTVVAATTMIMMNEEMRNDFIKAANKMSERIATAFPAMQQSGRGRNIASAQTGGGRGRGRGGRGGRGPGGRGRGGGRGRSQAGRGQGGRSGPHLYNGVDISDLTRYFHPEEWSKLSTQLQAKSRELKEKKKRNVAEVNTTVTADQTSNQTPQLNLDAGNSFGRDSYMENANGNKRSRTGQQE
jgi:hypothetical protein